ncbi:HEAT repeat-containing protein 3-like [Tropilaelaps mercedesae]|uniref:HEAT repeat-containing protein 3-like n=1 Tax=Tropilaelaps mercedesae TaxID=418985 RepID=A0A1V9XXI6_9ACAR|nr:HEAT repeat-containing protein 3-like [Tropilaelaps mercedesae]
MALCNLASDESRVTLRCDRLGNPLVLARWDSIGDLVTGLQSTTVTERASAAAFLCGIASDTTSRHEALRFEIIQAAAPLLLDKAAQVRHCIAGWLRDVSNAGPEVCETLVQANVLTYLVSLLQELLQRESASCLERDQNATLLDALNILTNLCENSERVVEAITRNRFVHKLFPLLTSRVIKISLAAGQCLLTITEDNPFLESIFVSERETLESVLHTAGSTPTNLLLKTTVAGIMHNLAAPAAHLPLLIATAKAALEHEIADHLTIVMVRVGRLHEVKKSRDLSIENIYDMEKELDLLLLAAYEILQAKKTALELIVNLCYAEDEEEQWDDVEEPDDDGMSIRSSNSTAVLKEPISAELQAALSSTQLLSAVLNHIGPLDSGMLALFNEYKPARQICKGVHEVRCRALLCIDNLAQSFDLLQAIGPEIIWEISDQLLQIAFATQRTNKARDPELLEAASSACRAVLEALVHTGKTTFAPIFTEEKLMMLCAVLNNASPPTGRANVARIVGTLAILHRPLVIEAGRFLTKVASQDTELRVCSEALDSLIDVFADDSTDTAARQMDLVNEMRLLTPRLKQMIRTSPKNGSKTLASTCYNNLLRFIQYKSKRLA